jgi:hypothetical protein
MLLDCQEQETTTGDEARQGNVPALGGPSGRPFDMGYTNVLQERARRREQVVREAQQSRAADIGL